MTDMWRFKCFWSNVSHVKIGPDVPDETITAIKRALLTVENREP